MIKIDPYTACALSVEIYSDSYRHGSATGFFWRVGQYTYLVSNWHVFSGREPRSGQPLNKTSYLIPNKVMLAFRSKNLLGPFSLMLNISSECGEALWVQHQSFGQRVDVAALDVTIQVKEATLRYGYDFDVLCANEIASTAGMAASVGSDVFVLGFPKGIMKTDVFPIWKRASIATEFDFDIDNLPYFIIDTATRDGMSGAPVVNRSFGTCRLLDGSVILGPAVYSEFIGVYSGRHVGGIDEAHLGIVWKRRVVDEIVTNGSRGDFDIYK